MTREQAEALIKVLPILPEIFQADFNIAISDMERQLGVFDHSRIDSKSKMGDTQEINPFLENILRSKKTFTEITDRFNIPAKATITPYYESDGSNGGLVFVIQEVERQAKVEQISESISSSFHQINENVEQIASESGVLSEDVNDTVQTVEALVEKIAGINEIIASIQNIADQSGLLSLNARIEAARAGEAGKGFGVVATEVSKLATMSKESSEKARKSLQEMKDDITRINEKIGKIEHVTSHQAQATEEISGSISNAFADLKILADISKMI